MTYRELSHQVKNNRGILALLRTRADRLTPDKQKKRDAFLAQNPAIDAIYQFQQQLHQLLMNRSEEHTSELQSLMRISYAVFCLKNTKQHILQTKVKQQY